MRQLQGGPLPVARPYVPATVIPGGSQAARVVFPFRSLTSTLERTDTMPLLTKLKEWGECLHCGRMQTGYRRGLCGPCYFVPEIRLRFPRRESSGNKKPVPPNRINAYDPRPRPGSEEKIRLLAERAARRLPLFWPGDLCFEQIAG
jgi:hypothetical protein